MGATAMHLTDQVTLYPHASISGRNGTVVDTAIDLHWPGPGRVYLHPREVAEAVRVAHVLPEVSDVLEAVGWVPGDRHTAEVAALTEQAETAAENAAGLEEKLQAALATIALVNSIADTKRVTEPGIGTYAAVVQLTEDEPKKKPADTATPAKPKRTRKEQS